jgi:hypothetical protein
VNKMQRIILITTIAFGIAMPLRAQQHQHAAAAAQHAAMAAMMCGGDMAAMMQMHGKERMDRTKHTDTIKPGMHRDDMMSGMHMMMGPPGPGMILQHQQKLGLSSAQVARLEALQKDAQPNCVHHMQAAMTAHQAANQLLDANKPNLTAFAAELKGAANHMVEGHVVMAKAAVAARGVLTAAQQQTLKSQLRAM